MKRLFYELGMGITMLFMILSCQNKEAQGAWIKGDEAQKMQIIEWQFRGFDKAMVETDYRYQDLYWAGKDQNWEYAAYLTQKINKAIATGLQRRPKRAASAEEFLTHALPLVKEAVKNKDTLAFATAFDNLTLNCNACHALEKLPFFTVKIPLHRHSSIRK